MEKINSLVLDIDGVLNNYSTDRYGPYSNQSIQQLKEVLRDSKQCSLNETWWDHSFELELANLQALRILIKKYSIKSIVICSTWRYVFSIPHLQMLFIAKGYPDIANLFSGTTSICTKEDRDRFNMTKRDRTIEIANYVLSLYKGYESNWYVLDDDVTEEDIATIKDIKHLKSLYFEFKATLAEYKRREDMLLNGLAKGESVFIHPLERDKEIDSDITKELKARYKEIKSIVLDPNIEVQDMVNSLLAKVQNMGIAVIGQKGEQSASERRDNKNTK